MTQTTPTVTPKSVKVKFASSSVLYEYFVPAGHDPKVGDLVVTSTVWPSRLKTVHGDRHSSASSFGIASVVEVLYVDSPQASKQYVLLISAEWLNNAYDRAKEAVDFERERAEARIKLDEMLRQRSDLEKYKALAENNPEAAKLLKILEE